MANITVLTDFGTEDGYVASMKGVILGLNPAAGIVDASHAIAPQDVEAASWVLSRYWATFPEGTIHVAVVDPGVGTDRDVLLAKVDGHWFLAPDNGLLTHVLAVGESVSVGVLDSSVHRPGPVSATFHGRDIFAYAAGLLSRGEDLPVCPVTEADIRKLASLVIELGGEALEGRVMHADHFGNLETNIPAAMLEHLGWPKVRVILDRHEISRIVRTYAEAETGEAVALVGSSGFLEISIVNGSALRELEAQRELKVIVEKENDA